MEISKRLTQILLFAVLLASFSFSLSAQERKLLPVDEAAQDASFKKFRDNLISAVRRRDSKYVLSVVDPEIKNGFAGEDGIENFKKQWKINRAKSFLWDELLFVLTRGGGFQREGGNKTFWAPYVYSKFPENLDAFDYSAVTGSSVKLFARPSASARLVANLSYNIVKVDFSNSVKSKSNADEYTWLKVQTTGGKNGFVEKRFVRSPIDYRAGFEKKRGRWKMTVFLAGD